MSDQPEETQRRPVSYYREYGPSRFRKKNGKPLKLRALQNAARRFRLPLITGAGEPLIVPEMGDRRLRELAKYQDPESPPRRRGRPRAAG
jgi:hypothetical protein